MRVLFLRRQRFGGIATYTNLLADALDREEIEAVVDDADDWIPNETGLRVDRKVGKVLRASARGFDLVHAFGFRTAWACDAGLHGGIPWIYSAHDMPRTTHEHLIERLNGARKGVCSSRACVDMLENSGARRLQLVHPGLPSNRRVLDKAESRAMLGVTDDEFLLAAAGRFVKEHALESLIHVVAALPHHVRLIISGQGPLEEELRSEAGERVEITTELFSQQQALAAADLVVVPSTEAGFSFSALEGMYHGSPALMRMVGGLTDIATERETGFFFETDEEMLDVISHLCYKVEEVAEVGNAAAKHVREKFDLDRTASEYAELYRSIVEKS